MKKKLLALICALALVFSLVGCTISAPDTVGSIGDFEITSGMYLLAQYGAYQQAAQLAGTDQDTTDVKAFLKETITTDSDSGETAVVSDYVAQKTQETLETLAKNIAYKVKRTKHSVSLEPMNPYERRIIHAALQNDKYVVTRSDGEEPFRHVIISLKRDGKKEKTDR